MPNTEIIVVGAGVVGLSVAVAICERFAGQYQVTIVGEHFPSDPEFTPDYTSPWAGAHFRPFPSKTKSELEELRLTRITQDYFKKLAQDPRSAIKFVTGIEYFEDPDEDYKNLAPGYTEGLDEFEVIKDDKLPPHVVFGTKYRTWVLNAPAYIQYLETKLRSNFKVKFIKNKLGSLKEVKSNLPGSHLIVNCTGNGLQYDGGIDKNCFPTRGQTLLIDPPEGVKLSQTITHQLKDKKWTFCIPRPRNGGIIVGGTKQPHDTYRFAREEDTTAIIQRASTLFPSLMKKNKNGEKYFDIKRVNIGFRPTRKGGFNLKVERANNITIINAYGAGGMGYELSYGVGVYVANKIHSLSQDASKL